MQKHWRAHPRPSRTNQCRIGVKDQRGRRGTMERNRVMKMERQRGDRDGLADRKKGLVRGEKEKETESVKSQGKVNIRQPHATCDHRTVTPSCLEDTLLTRLMTRGHQQPQSRLQKGNCVFPSGELCFL